MTPRSNGAENETGGGVLWLIPVGLCVLAWLAGVAWPHLLLRLGIHDYGARFLDSYALLAALDAVRAGADPHAANAFDPLMRPHVYSDWWLGLRWLGLGREHNGWFAALSVAAFVAAAGLTMRPKRLGDAVWLAALLVSPVVALVMNRANNDLLIFSLLAGCGAAACAGGRWQAIGIGLLVLAVGLKYYPVAAAAAFLWLRPAKGRHWLTGVAALAAVVALAAVWSQIERSRFMIGSGVYTMGAPIWWRDLGWAAGGSTIAAGLALALLAVFFVRWRITTGLAGWGDRRGRMLAAMGALVILACFVAGVNYAYRWIFALWPAWWLWGRAGDSTLSKQARLAASLGCALVLTTFWQDGVFCLVINALPPLEATWLEQAQRTYRLWTQPLHWLLMGMLAGWLLDGALTLLRAERGREPSSPS